MKIFSASQIQACDAYTIHSNGISSVDLMERAATACVDYIKDHYTTGTLFVVLCGTGNNGGDGLAITRLLHKEGYGAKAFLLMMNDTLSHDCQVNYERLVMIDKTLVETLQMGTFIADIPPNIVVIDAILGTGITRPPKGWLADFIQGINQLPNTKIAIDLPSGLPADNVPDSGSAVIMANDTLSFQFYKRSFFHPEAEAFRGNIHILDIGLNATFIAGTHTHYNTIDRDTILSIYHPRPPFAHKGNFGNAWLVGGSYGKMGAVVLAAQAALRAGAGIVTGLIPECGYTILQTAFPEALCQTNGDEHITAIEGWEDAHAIGIGPGLGMHEDTASAFAEFIDTCKMPVVLDADALNLLAKHQDLLNKIPADSILTPHPKEYTRLFGTSPDSMLQLEGARTHAMRYNVYIVLKGHHTAIVTPEGECWYNMTGNAGMATGGSGDVLTGIITGLLAQGYTSREAAILGVYLHGLAGDIAATVASQEAMIAGDITAYLGKAFQSLAKQ
jgi:ADP-dependent NAD(P)H-hydrate dehydratase / NAD(P)H-hydrate epimerase